MKKRKIGLAACKWFSIAACALLFAPSASAATEEVLHAFSGNDGNGPNGLTPDGAGSFYGSAFYGGSNGWGVVFKLSHSDDGWRETVLYNFKGGSEDGANPIGTLVLDSAGNLYGVTVSGGKGYGVRGEPGYGIAFELSPSDGGWTESIIHFFDNNEGAASSGFLRDASGNLYGETGGGGTGDNGTVYELRSKASGWEYGILYEFKGGNDGDYPFGGLIFDAKANLYGTTIEGGAAQDGTVFELERGAGSWTENQLYAFESTEDGVAPQAPVVFDKAGNLYGTTVYGGDVSCAQGFGCGLVFELSPSGKTWSKTTLYAFPGEADGHAPSAAMLFDKAGDLFGTTLNGGTSNTGALFELAPQAGGGWTESIVQSFTNGTNGGYPDTPLLLEGNNIYGTAGGGEYMDGVIFELIDVAEK